MHATTPLMSLIMSLFSVIMPTKMWFAPSQPITIKIDSRTATSLVLTHFDGTVVGTKDAPSGDATADLRTLFPDLERVGTFVLFAVPKGKGVDAFEGTPIVIEVLAEKNEMDISTVRIEPLRYVEMTTDAGKMTMCFFYDSAPNTVDSFLRLSSEGYYDGLTFHRIIPTFMLQGGDPRGNGKGGPGYKINEEFNDHKHEAGVLSMAREGDDGERQGLPPGPVAANSAGSQFFICLDYKSTQHLDNKYTAFGKVVEGTDTMEKLRDTPLQTPGPGEPKQTPVNAPVIQKAEALLVTPGHNPYAALGLGK